MHTSSIRMLTCFAAFAVLASTPAKTQELSASETAARFVSTLSDVERKLALIPFASRERKRWRYTPGHRGGLMLRAMDATTREAAFDVLRAVLSDFGFEVVEQILLREKVLGQLENNSNYRDPGKYYLAIFGSPGSPRWSLRFEGHHISLNVTFAMDAAISVLPLSLASNPERLPKSGKTLLTRFYDEARSKHRDETTGPGGIVRGLLSVYRSPLAATEADRLAERLAKRRIRKTGRYYRLTTTGVSLVMERAGRNHRHITLSASDRDFGGR